MAARFRDASADRLDHLEQADRTGVRVAERALDDHLGLRQVVDRPARPEPKRVELRGQDAVLLAPQGRFLTALVHGLLLYQIKTTAMHSLGRGSTAERLTSLNHTIARFGAICLRTWEAYVRNAGPRSSTTLDPASISRTQTPAEAGTNT